MRSTTFLLCCSLLFLASLLIVITENAMAFPVQAVLPKDKNAAQEVKPVINEPLLMTLLSSKAEWDFDHSSDFFCTLSALNTRNEFDLNFYCTGHAVAVFCDKKTTLLSCSASQHQESQQLKPGKLFYLTSMENFLIR